MEHKEETFLDEAFLRKLETLRILAHKGLKGKNTGLHKTVKSGSSQEFLDYRKYHPGDDLRYLDWNVYGRLSKLMIKLFHAEEDLSIHILVDMSFSMKSGNPSKEIYAKKIIAALSYIGLANLDQVGLTSFSSKLGLTKSPERGKQVYSSIIHYLNTLNVHGSTDFNTALKKYAGSCKKGGIAIVISDLLDENGYESGLKSMISAKFNTTLIQILDPEEISPTLKGYCTLKDVESGQQQTIFINTKTLASYKKTMTKYLSGVHDFCRKNNIDYHLADTNIKFEDFLLGYLNSSYFLNRTYKS